MNSGQQVNSNMPSQQDPPAGIPTNSTPPTTSIKPTDSPSAQPNTTKPIEAPEKALFSWEASEYIEHDRNIWWYLCFVLITIVLALGSALLLREWLGALVLVLMAAAVLMFARRTPKTLKCTLQGNGINIGDRFYPYNSFRSFSLVSDGALQSLEFDPLKRFMPRLSVYIAPGTESKVLDVLSSRMPQGDREQDAVDRLARKLKI